MLKALLDIVGKCICEKPSKHRLMRWQDQNTIHSFQVTYCRYWSYFLVSTIQSSKEPISRVTTGVATAHRFQSKSLNLSFTSTYFDHIQSPFTPTNNLQVTWWRISFHTPSLQKQPISIYPLQVLDEDDWYHKNHPFGSLATPCS